MSLWTEDVEVPIKSILNWRHEYGAACPRCGDKTLRVEVLERWTPFVCCECDKRAANADFLADNARVSANVNREREEWKRKMEQEKNDDLRKRQSERQAYEDSLRAVGAVGFHKQTRFERDRK